MNCKNGDVIMSKYAILSDIHGNLFALEAVMTDIKKNSDVDKYIILGDIIDYGMQSNEVVNYIIDNLSDKIICNIWGNHERAIMHEDYNFFSSNRGVESAKHTHTQLSVKSKNYLNRELVHEGKYEFEAEGKKILAVHGSLSDNYWRSVFPDNVNGEYLSYDIVLSGHSHYSHAFYKFYDTDNPRLRNKKAVLFVNPGSVGQPRNHNPNAQYAIMDFNTMSVDLRAVEYPKEKAMALFDGSVDDFYRARLYDGI